MTAARKTKITPRHALSETNYQRLAEFRFSIRRFLDFSEKAARAAGLTPQQHQALLAIRGLAAAGEPSIGAIAERLLIRHHSAVELVGRLVDSKLVRRRVDPADRRRAQIALTAKAQKILDSLSATHLQELHSMRPSLQAMLDLMGPSRSLDSQAG